MDLQATAPILLAHCAGCGAYTFPANAPGCRACGAEADTLTACPCPQQPRLHNFVTVYAELAAGLPVPCVIGEVELAPGLIEEALIRVADEAELTLFQPLRPRLTNLEAGAQRWEFQPVQEGRP